MDLVVLLLLIFVLDLKRVSQVGFYGEDDDRFLSPQSYLHLMMQGGD